MNEDAEKILMMVINDGYSANLKSVATTIDFNKSANKSYDKENNND